MSPIQIQNLDEEPEVFVLKLQGDIGLDLVPQMTAAMERHFAAGALHWAVDLSDVSFLGSPAVGAIMGLRSRVIRQQGSVSLFSAHAELKEKLNLMGVDLAIPAFKDWHSFLEYFRWEYRGASKFVDLTLPAKACMVPPMRRFIGGLLLSKGYGEKDVFVMESLADELANNAIEHGKPPNGIFQMHLKFDKKKMELKVANDCAPLSDEAQRELVEKYEHPKMTPGSLRGRGIVLVKKLSNQMSYRVEPRRVEVDIVRIREGK